MARKPYRVLEADDVHVEVAVRPPQTAGHLLAEMGLSRPGRAAVFAGRRLSREGRPLAHGDCLASGDVVTLELEVADAPFPDCEAATVLWEDPLGLALVAEKPQGLLVHGDGSGAETLADRVQAHLADEGRVHVAQAVQRLDVGTSGCVLSSLAPELQPLWDEAVAGADAEKRYLAVLAGALPGDVTVTEPIGRDRHDAHRMRVSATGKPAETRFSVVETRTVPGIGPVTLAEAQILTGRRHQIRVHAAHLGTPVVGDEWYDGPTWDGLLLHAWRETFAHPLTGERVAVESPVPPRIAALFPDACVKANCPRSSPR